MLEVVLGWAPPETDLKVRIYVQVVPIGKVIPGSSTKRIGKGNEEK